VEAAGGISNNSCHTICGKGVSILPPPAPGPDRAADLQQSINSAITRGDTLLVLQGGDCNFHNRTLLIQNATNFELRAESPVTFWFAGHRGGMVVQGCKNVTINGGRSDGLSAGLTIGRRPLPAMQATVTKATRSFVEFDLDEDSDSADPRDLVPGPDPSQPPSGVSIAPVTYSWKAGSEGLNPTAHLGSFDHAH
jgi:hypothetical protein